MQAAPPPLPRLRENLALLPGPAHRDGSPSWRIHDPQRNRFFEIGWMEFELMSRWQAGADPHALAAAVAHETPLKPDAADVIALAAFLEQNQLAVAETPDQMGRLKTRWLAGQLPWWKSLLHNYLFFRIPLWRPDTFLAATLPYIRRLARPEIGLGVVLAGLLGAFLAMRQAETFGQTFLYFFSLEGFAGYALAASFAKVVHELAHAWTAKHYGLRVPTMGIAFLVMWPVLYTDTGESWKLNNRRQRFTIAAAGIAAELALGGIALLLWSIAPEGIWKSVFFLLATTTWVMALAINLSPFMRFDGYYLLSDALDMPNMHERSFALARWWLRLKFFRLDDPRPEDFPPRRQFALIVFAIATWIYRLALFLGIAVLVYNFVVKLVGIFLMLVELVWFIARPFWVEGKALSKRRAELRPDYREFAKLGAAVLVLVWLFPVTGEVMAPAVIHAAEETRIFPPASAYIAQVAVKPGQTVAAGDLLMSLKSPNVTLRIELALAKARGLQAELVALASNPQRRERTLVLDRELEETLAEYRSATEDRDRLELHAPFDGRVTDLWPDMVQNRWVGMAQPLLRLVATRGSEVEAFLSEAQLAGVRIGQRARFYPSQAGASVVAGEVVAIDTVAGKQIARPLLASVYGGEIAARKGEHGELVANEALYRVVMRVDAGETPPPWLARGELRINADWTTLANNFLTRPLAVIIRESGF